jgi:hypothetical protein
MVRASPGSMVSESLELPIKASSAQPIIQNVNIPRDVFRLPTGIDLEGLVPLGSLQIWVPHKLQNEPGAKPRGFNGHLFHTVRTLSDQLA